MKKCKLIISIILISFFLNGCYGYNPIEKLGMVVGIGNDIHTNSSKDNKPKYSATFDVLLFQGNDKITSIALPSESETVYSTINKRQNKENKDLLTGAEQVYLLSQSRAEYGIKDLIDSFVRDPLRNEHALIAVSKQPTYELFSFKTPFALSPSEHIHDLLEFAHTANFFEKDIDLIRFLTMYNEEGRKIVIPYIEILNNSFEITGLALFKGDKMLRKVSLDEARLINLMRTTNSEGYLNIIPEEYNSYIDFFGRNKSTVKASKENDRLKYDIFVNLTGTLTLNTLVEEDKTLSDPDKVGEILSKKLEKNLTNEVHKMQNEYKTDWLDLGQYAIAKYGRDKGYSSDEQFCNSIINVHVNVKVTSTGRKVDK
ncbi:Ger(x)C family spore germination protein [Clostridium sp. MB40-C1]|uniref:Ger(x)C family spore germination protein n=1 Tax=Clostridium sp. MB40-C1 TaxID=3070996 RepID=UPI0027E0AE1F|nr:Ger(x)C family spore germination protein [Clostridium sp. MB40-C1]WMJ79931.1 Ger(x)C family spore germination protein [Clostridium sp. MB40-C1]